MDKNAAERYVLSELAKFNSHYDRTEVVIEAVLTYDFGWYFSYGVRGEILMGGPDHGILIHKLGHKYALHYVGTPWDTGIGNHMTEGSTIEQYNSGWRPSKISIRYFLKQVRVKDMVNRGLLSLNTSFKTKDGYDLEGAIKWLKLELCMPLKDAIKWVQTDSGRNLTISWPQPYDTKYREEMMRIWCDMKNEGLLDENWEAYYNKDIK